MTTRITLCALALVASGAAFAKIPAPVLDDAAKAKAAEAAAKTAWQGKVDGFKLCKAQERVAAHYKKGAGGKDAKAAAPAAGAAPATPACADPGAFVYPPPAAAAAPAATTTAAAPAAKAPAKKP